MGFNQVMQVSSFAGLVETNTTHETISAALVLARTAIFFERTY